MSRFDDFLSQKLVFLDDISALRKLPKEKKLLDFCSNDYLGLSKSTLFKDQIEEYVNQFSQVGSTGSRLLTGNSNFIEELENDIAQFHNAKTGLIFNSGYDANMGLLSTIPQRGDTILFDEFIHASLREGARLSLANAYSFKHNDLDSLEDKIKRRKETVFVVIESIYSMGGDLAPLVAISELCKRYNCLLIVDEAHATGIFGCEGRGLVDKYNLEDKVYARIHTFSKALACHGAIILGNDILKTYLVNHCKSFIYTTAMPYYNLAMIKAAYTLSKSFVEERKQLFSLINCFLALFENRLGVSNNNGPIQFIKIKGNEAVKAKADLLQHKGFDIRAILSPTVPKGEERLRISLHVFNTEKQLIELSKLI